VMIADWWLLASQSSIISLPFLITGVRSEPEARSSSKAARKTNNSFLDRTIVFYKNCVLPSYTIKCVRVYSVDLNVYRIFYRI
jgi:hypothetical protein